MIYRSLRARLLTSQIPDRDLMDQAAQRLRPRRSIFRNAAAGSSRFGDQHGRQKGSNKPRTMPHKPPPYVPDLLSQGGVGTIWEHTAQRGVQSGIVSPEFPIDPNALNWLKQNVADGHTIGYMKPGTILALAQRGVRLRNRLIQAGFSPPAAAALAGNAMVESHGYYGSPQLSGGPGYGLWQWTPYRRDKFKQHFHKEFSAASEDDQIAFMAWEMGNDPAYSKAWAALHSPGSAGQMATSVALIYEGMHDKKKDPEQRAAIAELLNTIPVDPRMSLAPPSSPPPEVEAFLRRQSARARAKRR